MKEFNSWQIAWLVAAFFAFIGFVIVFWLKNRPEDYGQHKDGISPERGKELDALAAQKKKMALTYRTTHQFTLAEALKLPQLYNLMFSVLMQYSALVFLVAHHFGTRSLQFSLTSFTGQLNYVLLYTSPWYKTELIEDVHRRFKKHLMTLIESG